MGKKYILSADLLGQLINFVISQDQKIPEDWKEIDGTDGRYYISNCGRVLSLKRSRPVILKPYDRSGYKSVKILGKAHSIHRLVAQYFISDKIVNNKQLVVHHKDNNKHNNNYNNLEILTYQEHYDKHKEVINNDK